MIAASKVRWFQSGLHPTALRLDDTQVAAGNVDSADLVAAIAALRPPEVITQLRCTLEDSVDATALQDAGFRQVGLTKLLTIPLTQCNALPMPDLRFQWVTPDQNAAWTAWFAAHWDSYKRHHKTNPAADLGRAADPFNFGGADLVEALFVMQEDDLVGFSSLRLGQEVGWIDTCGNAPNTPLLQAILNATLRRATAHGWSSATLEVDDEDHGLWEIAAALKTIEAQTYIAWQYDLGA